MKQLLICPFCRANKIKSLLGEVDDEGNVVVKRKPGAYTIIESDDIRIRCGTCGELIYFKNENKR